MRKIFTTKKRIVIGAGAAAVVLATGGTAFAFYTSTGTGTGTANVGSAQSWTVGKGTDNGTLYPGVTDDVIFTIHNQNSNTIRLNASDVTAGISNNGADVFASNGTTAVTGCSKDWFIPGTVSVSNDGTNYGGSVDVPASGTAYVQVPVTFHDDGTNQDACQKATSGIDVTVGIN